MQREVFDALGMTNTSPDKNDSIIVNRTSFYEKDSLENVINAPYVDNSYKWAGGGFISTTTDLIKFGKEHMKPGFLSESTLNELTTPLVLNNGDTTTYGFGWDTRMVNGEKVVAHGGGSVGGITQFRIHTKSGLILVMLSNSSNTQYRNLPDRIIKLFLQAKD